MRIILAMVILFLPAFTAQAQTGADRSAINNEGLVILARAGYNEKFLLELIRTKDSRFDTSVEGLVYLAKQGVSERVVRAILAQEKESKEREQSEEAVAPAVHVPMPPLPAGPVRMKKVRQTVLVPDPKSSPVHPNSTIVVQPTWRGDRYYAVPQAASSASWSVR